VNLRRTAARRDGRGHRRRDRERGVVLVEFAMVMTLLLTMGLGIYEFGFAWRSAASVTSGARSAARTVSSLATDDSADYQSLSSIRSDLQASGLLSKLELVVIYKSTTADGDVPAACMTNTTTGALCDIYTGEQVRSMLESDFSTTTGCMTGMVVANYCPNVRNPIMATADYVGVWVKVRHDYQTGLLGSGLDITKYAVMRVEPRVA
jgi:Flp pilus assembly protein TadG